MYAAQCIGELKLNIDATTDIESWKFVAKHIFDSLILHLDGPEIVFRKTLLGKRQTKKLKENQLFKDATLCLESMGKLTENEANAAVFRTALADLPASHPCLKELKNVTENID